MFTICCVIGNTLITIIYIILFHLPSELPISYFRLKYMFMIKENWATKVYIMNLLGFTIPQNSCVLLGMLFVLKQSKWRITIQVLYAKKGVYRREKVYYFSSILNHLLARNTTDWWIGGCIICFPIQKSPDFLNQFRILGTLWPQHEGCSIITECKSMN